MKVSVMGGSGYAGGELLRLLLSHPSCQVQAVTSRRYPGEPLYRVHPNLRGITNLRFESDDSESLLKSDIVFTALPHGKSMKVVPTLLGQGVRVIDLGADFRLKDPEAYKQYYSFEHEYPDLLGERAYGLPEFHRDEIRKARLVSVPGCMATAAILGVAPVVSAGLVETDKIIVDAKIGSSGAGVSPTIATHHSERSDGVRPYKTVGHRHIAEIEQELKPLANEEVRVSFTPHAVGMVRGILTTTHTFAKRDVEKKEVWKAYRGRYEKEPFVRMVSDNKGLYGLPNPKVTVGTNFCDIGFETDIHTKRVVIFAALDNLTKGAAGQAVQCYNIITGVDERTGLESTGLHP